MAGGSTRGPRDCGVIEHDSYEGTPHPHPKKRIKKSAIYSPSVVAIGGDTPAGPAHSSVGSRASSLRQSAHKYTTCHLSHDASSLKPAEHQND